jgi:hypothetical protein
MNHSISPGLVPPRPGLEREEPELADEDDIPTDRDTAQPPEQSPEAGQEERQHAERE